MIARRAATLTLALGGVGILAACASSGPTGPGEVSRVVVTPRTVTILAFGDTIHLTARAIDAVGRTIEGVSFSWESSAGQIASVDQSGVVTSHRNGPTTIIARTDDVSGDAQITVVQTSDSVSVTPAAFVLTGPGATRQLTAEGWDANGNRVADAIFDWNSSNPSVADVDATGLVTGIASGPATITADAGTATGTANATVTEAVATVEVEPAGDTLAALGDTVRFEAVAKSASGSEIPGVEFSWGSDDEGVATVDDAGLASAVGNGTAKITAAADGVDGSATLVVDQRAASVSMSPSSLPTFDALGDTVRLSAEAFDANSNPIAGAQFVWSSTDTLVASVDGSGLVTIAGNGAAMVKALIDGIEGSVGVEVSQVVDTVDIEPDSPELTAIGALVGMQATALDANGFEVEGKNFDWMSSQPQVATITAAGLVEAVGNGATIVTATTDGVSGQTRVTVQQQVSNILIDPEFVALEIDEVVLLTATAYDFNGHEVEDQSYDWESSNELVASVTALGAVRGKSAGVAIITASIGPVEGMAEVAVGQFAATIRPGGSPDR